MAASCGPPAAGGLSTRGAYDVLTALAEDAGIAVGLTPHVLRHTAGTTLTGTDIVIVAKLLGRSSRRAAATPCPARRTAKPPSSGCRWTDSPASSNSGGNYGIRDNTPTSVRARDRSTSEPPECPRNTEHSTRT